MIYQSFQKKARKSITNAVVEHKRIYSDRSPRARGFLLDSESPFPI